MFVFEHGGPFYSIATISVVNSQLKRENKRAPKIKKILGVLYGGKFDYGLHGMTQKTSHQTFTEVHRVTRLPNPTAIIVYDFFRKSTPVKCESCEQA